MNPLTTITPEQRARRWALSVKIGIVIVLGIVAVPIVGLAIEGIAGLIVAGLLAASVVACAPAVGSMAANWRLKLLKAEAARNPVETLQNEYKKRAVELGERKAAIAKFIAAVSSYADKVKEFAREHPDAAEIEDNNARLAKLQLQLDHRKTAFVEAGKALAEFAQVIEKAQDIWELSLAAIEADNSAGSVEDEFTRRIQVNTSLGAITENLNLSFAKLDTALLESKTETKTLPPRHL